MKVSELITLLQQQDQDLNISVGSYQGRGNGVGWNESHEPSHGPIWVGEHAGRCFIGINCYGAHHKPDTYRTIQGGKIVTSPEYYGRSLEKE